MGVARTRFVPSYSDQIVLFSNDVTLVPRENGRVSPDFWTKVDTAADPSVRR